MTGETELHERLTRLAERTAPPPRETLAGTVVATHRARRRQTIGMTSLAAAVAALVVVTTATLGGRPQTVPISADPAGPAAATATAAPVDVLAGPTRGSLAGDTAFVEAVRQLDWTPNGQPVATEGFPGVPDAPVETRRVVFAGDVAGGRWALVAGTNTAQPEPPYDAPEKQTDLGALSEVAVAWFTGPPGATPDQLELLSVPRGVDPQYPQALSDSLTGALVVITAPGDEVSISLRPEIAADGSASRDWQPVDAPDGLVVQTFPSSGASYPAVRYRVTRGGTEVITTGPDGRGREDWTPPEVPLTRLRPAPPPAAGDVMVESEVDRVLAQLGLPVAELSFAVAWAGDVPGPHDRPARVTVLAVTLPSGAIYVTAPYGYAFDDDGGGVGGSGCGSQVLPAGVPLEQRTWALRCDVADGTAEANTVSSLVVVGPASASSARAVDLDGEVLDEFALTDGVAVVPFPQRTATVQALAPDGSLLEATRPLTFADLGD